MPKRSASSAAKTVTVSWKTLQSVREMLGSVLDIIEDTYGHDDSGERDDTPSEVSGADVVDNLLGLENELQQAVDTLDDLLEET